MISKKVSFRRVRPVRPNLNPQVVFGSVDIKQFRDVFTFIDQDCDGIISKDDISKTATFLSNCFDANEINEMMLTADAGKVDFPNFLSMFAEKYSGSDPKETVLHAFHALDENGSRLINKQYLSELLTTLGDKYSKHEIASFFDGAPLFQDDLLYEDFVNLLKCGETCTGNITNV